MNKNPDRTPRESCVVMCPDAFRKCSFLDAMVRSADRGVLYVDFDLLYSGYVAAGIIRQPPHTLIRRPDIKCWKREVAGLVHMTSMQPYLIVIDSLNGMAGMWPGRDATRLANHSLMLLAAMGRDAGTRVVAAAVARKGNRGWDLTPGGRHIPVTPIFTLEDWEGPPRMCRDDAGSLP